MQTSPLYQPSADRAHAVAAPRRRVIDAPTRMFHWLFALSFVGAYLTADGERWRALHVTLGYTLAGLLAFRVLYGIWGPRHAGLSQLMRKLASGPAWLRSVSQGLRQGTAQGIQWRQGQNLAMALLVLALLLLVVPLTLSGYGTYSDWGDFFGEWLEDMHELFGDAFLAVVLGHVALLFGLSVLRRKNQALPMLTGLIEGAGPDLVKRNNFWLAALMFIAVLAFVGWEWQQAPQGLFPVQGPASTSSDRPGDDDD